jgi:hypothetical protein
MIKWVIFYCALTGANEAPMGEALFFQGDSLQIFDTVWEIKRMVEIEEYGDKLYSGIFDLEHKGVKATLTVLLYDVTFKIASTNNNDMPFVIRFRQRPHHKYLYEFIDEEYEVEQKSFDKESRKDRRARREKYEGLQSHAIGS